LRPSRRTTEASLCGQAYRNLLLKKLLERVVDTYKTVGDSGHGTYYDPGLIADGMPSMAGIQQVQSIRVDAAFSQSELDTPFWLICCCLRTRRSASSPSSYLVWKTR
jgi:hypothetical protein